MTSTKGNIELTGADKFILALDRHAKKNGGKGTVCHYIIEFDKSITTAALKNIILADQNVNAIKNIYLKNNSWRSRLSTIDVLEIKSEDFIPTEIESLVLNASVSPLFTFHLVESRDRIRLVLSWHHLLMDGFGARLFMQSIFQATIPTEIARKRSPLNLTHLVKARKAKRYVSNTARNSELSMISQESSKESIPQLKLIRFGPEELDQLKANARSTGAKFGIGNYILAATSLALFQSRKSNEPVTYWVPIPQDQRKKGAKGPLIGNHLSMMFYRISVDKDSTLESLIKSLDSQMIKQIKEGITENYMHLMNYMRITPSWLYHRMIKGPNGKSLSSFLFTYAPENATSALRLNEISPLAVYNIPPNTYPPGLTFSVNQYDHEMQLIMQYYSDVLSNTESQELANLINKILLLSK